MRDLWGAFPLCPLYQAYCVLMENMHNLFLNIGSRPLFLEQGDNIRDLRISSYGTKAGEFVQMTGIINLKKRFT